MTNFRERLGRLTMGLLVQPISRTRFIKCAFLNSNNRFRALSAFLASEVGYTGRTVGQKRVAPDSLICPVPTVKTSRTTALSGSADYLLFVCRDHSTPPLLSRKHGMGSRLLVRRVSPD